MQANVDYLATFNRRRFVDDPEVTAPSGIPIGTPGEAPDWVREHLSRRDR
jgi:hypothetical protein